ncbi:hypothetical protein HYT57_01035 [Candidatus Woesearchaeota archaeon]|nr:hypothetical protein [Candidatus Woesearchaeota archaeon]
MNLISDLQIHSSYSRATSKNITFQNLEKYAKIKGLDLLGTGDFQHPKQFEMINKELEEDENGILWSKTKFPFLWQTEISLIYTQNGKGQRIHHLIFSPSKDVAKQIIGALGKKGRLDYDGRPIFGFNSIELVDMMRGISEDIEIIPAHVWTSHFSLMGEYNQLTKVEDCFQDNTKYIHALETGMSSNPADNWRINSLDKFQLVSFSDAHCVHPETFITLEDGYVLPIDKIANELVVSHADFKDMSYKNGIKIQNSKIFSPSTLKYIKYDGGEIKVSENHRFYAFENENIKEKYASELKSGDFLVRIARIDHTDKGSIELKRPKFDTYFKLNDRGTEFLKKQRIKNGYFQKELADLIGLHVDHYWKIEKGLVKINKRFLINLSNILDFNYKDFIKESIVEKYPNFSFPKESSVELLELLGYTIGDGCFTKINRGECILLTDKNEKILKYYQAIVRKLFLCNSRLHKCTTKGSYELVLPSLVSKFIKINFSELSRKSQYRNVPRRFYSLPLEQISAFLRGFFDAEGCMGHHGADACSANKLLIYQIDSLLKKYGIFTSFHLNQLNKEKKKFRHRLYIYGENLKIFYENINFNHEAKKFKLESYISKLTIHRKSKIKRLGDFILCKVKFVGDINSDTDYLYDISVPVAQNYFANQIVVHNSHWPWRLGREATIFDFKELTYNNFLKAIRTGSGFKSTIETPTLYGKYHYTGHRNCDVVFSPDESRKLNKVCPKCHEKLTIGVADRIEKLADRPEGYKRGNSKPFVSLIPLHELISSVYDIKQLESKKVWEIYNLLIKNFNNEFNVLLNVKEDELKKIINEKLAKVILMNREGKLRLKAGFDGVYGSILLDEEYKIKMQKSLGEF